MVRVSTGSISQCCNSSGTSIYLIYFYRLDHKTDISRSLACVYMVAVSFTRQQRSVTVDFNISITTSQTSLLSVNNATALTRIHDDRCAQKHSYYQFISANYKPDIFPVTAGDTR